MLAAAAAAAAAAVAADVCLKLVFVHAEDADAVEVAGLVVDQGAGLRYRRVVDQIPAEPGGLATTDTLVRSIARRWRIQRVQRRVVLARDSANVGSRCRNMCVSHSVSSQVKRDTRRCSLLGWPSDGVWVERLALEQLHEPERGTPASSGPALVTDVDHRLAEPTSQVSDFVEHGRTARRRQNFREHYH